MGWDPSMSLDGLSASQCELVTTHLLRAFKLVPLLSGRYRVIGEDGAHNAVLCGLVAAARNYKEENGEFFPFATRHIFGAAMTACRRRGRVRFEVWTDEYSPSIQSRPDLVLVAQEAGEGLSDDERALVNDLYVMGYSVTEAAEQREVSVSSISHRKRRVLSKMRDTFDIGNHDVPGARIPRQHIECTAANDAVDAPRSESAPTVASESAVSSVVDWPMAAYTLMAWMLTRLVRRAPRRRAGIVHWLCSRIECRPEVHPTIRGYRHVETGPGPMTRWWNRFSAHLGRGPPSRPIRRPRSRREADDADETS